MVGMWLGANAGDRLKRLVLCEHVGEDVGDSLVTSGSPRFARAESPRSPTPFATLVHARYLARADETFGGLPRSVPRVDPVGYIGCCAAIRDMDLTTALASIRRRRSSRRNARFSTPKEMGAAIAAAIPARAASSCRRPYPAAGGRATASRTRSRVPSKAPRRPPSANATASGCGRAGSPRRGYVDERLKQVTPFNAEFQDLITRYAWGEMWTRNVLDDRMRRLLVLAMLIAQSRWEEFEMHVKAGLNAELSQAELKEVLLLAAIYCGVPAANTGFHQGG